MKRIVFLASAEAQKPEILIKTFYESIDRKPQNDVLLTNDEQGNVVDLAKQLDMSVVICSDSRFSDSCWVKNNLSEFKDAVLVSCGWPYKIPLTVIESFFAAINCHGSYLPDYRGSRAYMHYWANCSDHYGATIHYLNEKFDDGNILIRGKLKMFEDESHNQIFIRTAELCGHLLVSALLMIESNDSGFTPEGLKRYFYKMTPEEFAVHRRKNEELRASNKAVILTPHKVID